MKQQTRVHDWFTSTCTKIHIYRCQFENPGHVAQALLVITSQIPVSQIKTLTFSFANYRLEIFISQLTDFGFTSQIRDFHFASFHFVSFRFVSFHFVSFRFVSFRKLK